MSTTIRKLGVLSLVLILVLSSILAGCATKEPAAQELVTATIDAITRVKFFTSDMTIETLLDITTSEQSSQMKMNIGDKSMVDVVNKTSQATINLSIDQPGQQSQQATITAYAQDEWFYLSLPATGGRWVKTRPPQEIIVSQNQIAQQIELLKSATDASIAGTENVGNTPCYIVKLTPNPEAMVEWFQYQQQFNQAESTDTQALVLSQLFKNVTFKGWIAKSNNLIMKVEIEVLAQVRAEDIPVVQGDFEKIAINMKAQVNFSDYDKKVSIQLPPGTANAQEIPYWK